VRLSDIALFRVLFSAQRLRLYVWLSLASQILIVVTGGLVRLTGSGLGCPTWPKCTDDSFTTTPEMGIHGFIEFANRTLTGVLAIIAILTFVAVWKNPERTVRGLLAPAFGLPLGIVAQIVLGGLTVRTKLNPWLVGGHFIISAVMIAAASVLVWRALDRPQLFVPEFVYRLSWPIVLFGAITVVVGVLVTGAGPHSGDANSARNGLDLEVWQHYHSYPAYALLLLVALQLVSLWRTDAGRASLPTKISGLLLVVLVLQAVVGVVQARLGVPPLLVGVHMLGASCLVSLLTFNYLASTAK